MQTEPEIITLELETIGVTSLNRDAGGQYVFDTISVSNGDSEWPMNMTTFIVKVVDENSTYYYWEVNN